MLHISTLDLAFRNDYYLYIIKPCMIYKLTLNIWSQSQQSSSAVLQSCDLITLDPKIHWPI